MTRGWLDVLAVLAGQHLWQCAVLALLAWAVSGARWRLGAEARSWILLCAFATTRRR